MVIDIDAWRNLGVVMVMVSIGVHIYYVRRKARNQGGVSK